MTEFQGKHAVITGGGSGIGRMIAKRLTEAGAHVTIMARTEARLNEAAAGMETAVAIPVDVTDEDAVEDAFAQARHAFGTVAILVNNAGIVETAPFHKTRLETWKHILDVNLTGAFLCTRQAVGDITNVDQGRIINLASTAGLKGYAYTSAYTASKHGLIGLTRALAVELAGTGATVNAICPGFTKTGMVDKSVEAIVDKTGRPAEDVMEEFVKYNPQGRLVTPEEIAECALWLASAAAGSITGQSIAIAGGEVM